MERKPTETGILGECGVKLGGLIGQAGVQPSGTVKTYIRPEDQLPRGTSLITDPKIDQCNSGERWLGPVYLTLVALALGFILGKVL